MKNLIKNILSIAVIYLMCVILFMIGDIIYGIVYYYVSYFIIAIVPVSFIWFILQYSIAKFILRKLISNGIYYLIIQFLIFVFYIVIKYSSYLWYIQNYKDSHVSLALQQSTFIAELVLGGFACLIIAYTWKRFYKQ